MNVQLQSELSRTGTESRLTYYEKEKNK